MSDNQTRAVLDRVLTWPAAQQAEAVELLTRLEARNAAAPQLSEEQLAEVRRRRAEADPEILTLAQFDKRLRRFDG
jgi:hypothetical protein